MGIVSAALNRIRTVASAVGKALGARAKSPVPPQRGRPGRSRPSSPRRRGPEPVAIKLSSGQRKKLKQDARRRALPYGQVMRAKIVLQLAQDPGVSAAAVALGVDAKTVRYWRDRYLREGRRGLRTRPKSGRPVSIDLMSRCQIVAMACGKPIDFGVEFRPVWTLESLLATYRMQNPERAPLSRTSVFRVLHQDGIRPHRMRVWLHSPDPLFREKVTEICNLYLRPPLGAVVLCIDEKTGMQALSRKHPTRPPGPGRDGRVDFEYKRHGTVTLIAAFNPHTGEVYGETPPNRKAPTLVAFMEAVAERWPNGEIHIIWDNLNTHHDGPAKRWTEFNARHGGRFYFHYTPIHASWVNQVENFFSILDRRVWRHCVHRSKKELVTRVMGFIGHWNARERHPFNWKFQGYPTPPIGDTSPTFACSGSQERKKKWIPTPRACLRPCSPASRVLTT